MGVSAVLVVVGLLVVAVAGYDALLTTLAPASGAGPISGRLVRVAMRWGPHRSRGGLLPPGTGLLLATVMTWVGLLWLGWTLALGAGAGSVVSSTTGAPASLSSRFYFAGFTVLTLGIGDYVPSGAWAQVGTVAAVFSGLFVVTLAITYLLNVVTAVVEQRTLAAEVWLHAETGGLTEPASRQDLDGWLATQAPRVLELAMRHLAYPVMHRFTDTDPSRSAVVAMAVLTDAVESELERVPAAGPGAKVLGAALDVYMDTVRHAGSAGHAGGSRRARMAAIVAAAGQQWPSRSAPDG